MIYLDNAATTYPKFPGIDNALKAAIECYSFNSGRGSYFESTRVADMIYDTRAKVSSIVKSNPDNVIFTASATEAINSILSGLDINDEDVVFVSPFEHNSVIRTLYKLGANIKLIPFDRETWKLNYAAFKSMLALSNPKAIVLSQISNVVGYELPYDEIFELAKKVNSICILDAAQGFGIFPINTKNIDFIVFAGHKSLYSIYGVGGYINISNTELSIYKAGGTGSDSLNLEMPRKSPYRYEAGSMNSTAIYCLNKSLDFIKENNIALHDVELVEYFIKQLEKINSIRLLYQKSELPKGIVSVIIKDRSSDDVGKFLYENFGIAVRTGYHCAPLIHDFLNTKEIGGTVRISIGAFNTKSDIDILLSAIKDILKL